MFRLCLGWSEIAAKTWRAMIEIRDSVDQRSTINAIIEYRIKPRIPPLRATRTLSLSLSLSLSRAIKQRRTKWTHVDERRGESADGDMSKSSGPDQLGCQSASLIVSPGHPRDRGSSMEATEQPEKEEAEPSSSGSAEAPIARSRGGAPI